MTERMTRPRGKTALLFLAEEEQGVKALLLC